jgi:pimeloyl-ACP methyl ester carboxylesterase
VSNETVILVHGLWMTGVELSLLQRRLRTAGYRVRKFRYRMLSAGLNENRKKFAEFIASHSDEQLHIIGHSLGGVLALHVLQKFPELNVKKIICLGSPVLDSSAARGALRFRYGSRLIGKTLIDATVDQPLSHWNRPQPVGMIAGSRGIGMSRSFAKLPKPNDGAVTVAETCLPGLADHLVVRTSHSGLLFSQEVARQCDWFLRHGCFRR